MRKKKRTSVILVSAVSLLVGFSAIPCAAQPHGAPTLEPGKVVNVSELPDERFLDYRRGGKFRGENTLLEWRTFVPGEETRPEVLRGERVLFVLKGMLETLVDGAFTELREKDVIYREEGSKTALRAGKCSAEVIEVRWSPHPGHAGKPETGIAADVPEGKPYSTPTVPPGMAFNYDYLQWCDVGGGILAKVVQGRYGQVCFLRLEPDTVFPGKAIPEEQLLIVLRGRVDMSCNGGSSRMERYDVVYIPPGMEHSARTGPLGCEILAVFSPARPAFTGALKRRIETFHSIVPKFARPKLLLDGRFGNPLLGFTEGPNWLRGKLYFSDQQYGGLYTLGRDGSYRVVNRDIAPCGTAVLPSGNLAVCDIKNRRIVEMSPDGEILRTMVGSYRGERFRGVPNDVITDGGGGLYFTVMTFSGEKKGNAVFHCDAAGRVARVTEYGEVGIPNGCVLSPDGERLYVDDDTSGFVWVFDVGADGTLSNKRPFAKLILHESGLGKERLKSYADGMTVDEQGNIYVCASGFIQIFDPGGNYRGGFVFPKPAFHCTFGGVDGSTLYVTCMNQIYSLKTKMHGVR